MRRREFNASLLIPVTVIQPLLAQTPTTQPRIAIVAAEGKPESISEAGSSFWRAFFGELRRLGHIEGSDLIVERYSAEGDPGRYTDLAREVMNLNPGSNRTTQPGRNFRNGQPARPRLPSLDRHNTDRGEHG